MLIKPLKNIILIDDHIIVRHGLKELIEKLGNYRISHQFDNGEEFLENFQKISKPDLILLDLSMPGMRGEEVMEQLNELGINTPVLILTMIEEEEMIIKLRKLGARGYLMKGCDSIELKTALNDIFESGFYYGKSIKNSAQTNTNETKKIAAAEKVKDYMFFTVNASLEKINIKLSDILYVKTHPSGKQNKYVILKNGVSHILIACGFNQLMESCTTLIRINKSELISIEAIDTIKSDVITLKIASEDGRRKQVYLNRWYKKTFLDSVNFG
jgi:DNA-binding NarL/FixJ family response regulator